MCGISVTDKHLTVNIRQKARSGLSGREVVGPYNPSPDDEAVKVNTDAVPVLLSPSDEDLWIIVTVHGEGVFR